MRLSQQNIDDIEQIESTERRVVRQRMNASVQKKYQTKPNKYGNMWVLYDGKFLITLGPDYVCFIPTFIIFLLIAVLMTWFIFTYSNQFYLKLCTICICIGTCVSYLAVAISNPGVVLQEDFTDSDIQNKQKSQNQPGEIKRPSKRLCRRCNIRVQKGTFHCEDCDVCIRNYDHHCPWTSKCIGGGNLVRFYIFVFMIPVFLIYIFVAFAITMSQMAIDNANKIHVI